MVELRVEPPVLLLGAHWDDEILLAGGLLFKYGKDWDVVCCTIKDHMMEDQKKFNMVCKQVGSNPTTLPIYHRLERYDGHEDVQKFRKRAQRVTLTKDKIVNGFIEGT